MGAEVKAFRAGAGGRPFRGVGHTFVLAVVLATLLCAGTAWAQTFSVTNLKDSGPGSLRRAMHSANSNEGPDQITFARSLSGTIRLRSTLPTVTDPAGLVIGGGGDVKVSGTNYGVRALSVGGDAMLSLRGLIVAHGGVHNDGLLKVTDSTLSRNSGSAVSNTGTLEVTNSTFSDNSGDRGGGIYNDGLLKVTDSTLSRNSGSEGGGIYNDGGTLELVNSIVSSNHASFSGGGILNTSGGIVTITGSTISGNSTDLWGAGQGIDNQNGTVEVSTSTISEHGSEGHNSTSGEGIRHVNGTLEVANSTFSANVGVAIANYHNSEGAKVTGSTFSGNVGTAIYNSSLLEVANSTFSDNRSVGWRCEDDCVEIETPGGGIHNAGGRMEVSNSTFEGNSASTGSAVYNEKGFDGNAGKATLRSTVVANSTSGSNCGGEVPVGDGGDNVDDGTTCGFAQATGSLPNTDPLLDPDGLQDNGGPTHTIALLPDSPAVDLVAESACPPPDSDQRGVQRPQGDACDAGAFELEADDPPPPGPDPERCTIEGTRRSDTLVGTERDDVICAMGGADVLVGKGGEDILRGGGGEDSITGGDGPDELFGGAADDVLNAKDGVRGNDLADGDRGDDECVTDRRDQKESC